MFTGRLKYYGGLAVIFAVLYLITGHNFIHHAHEETTGIHFETHEHEDHHEGHGEHSESDIISGTHLHLFYNKTGNRSVITADKELLTAIYHQESIYNEQLIPFQKNIFILQQTTPVQNYCPNKLKGRSPPVS